MMMMMRATTVLVFLPFLLGSPAVAEPALQPNPRYTVTRVQASPDTSEGLVALIIAVAAHPAGGARFWVLERRVRSRHMGETGVRHEWIDGRRCPALGRAVAGIAKLPSMRFAAPEATAPFPPFHLAITTLRGPGSPVSGLTVSRSDVQGGVSAWWAQSERTLANCWQETPVAVESQPLRGFLDTQEDADRWAR